MSHGSSAARTYSTRIGNYRGTIGAMLDAIRGRGSNVGWLLERAGEFLPWHWNRPQLGHCRRAPRSAGVQRCDHVVALHQPVQQADGERIAGACGVYLVSCDGIDMQFAGGGVCIRTVGVAPGPPRTASGPAFQGRCCTQGSDLARDASRPASTPLGQ